MHLIPSLIIATICAHGSFVHFTLPLEDDGHVSVSNDLLGLKFNLQIGTMYVEQEMYIVDGDISESILMQKNRSEDGHVWILGLGTFRVIGLFDCQWQNSIVISTNKSVTSTVKSQESALLN